MPNVNLNLVDLGQGNPAIVFIHGFTCDLSSWKEQLPVLSGNCRCIAFDLPGHGESADSREASVEALARAVNEGLDALGLDNVVLVGHSMGCRVASETYSQSPNRVRGVIYVDGSMLATSDADEAMKRAVENIERVGMARFVAQLYDGFFVDGTPAEVRDFVNAALPAVRLEFARALWPSLVRWDAARSLAVLKTIDVPVLVIQSTSMDADLKRVSLVPGDETPWTTAVSSAVKDVTVKIVENVGHFPMLETPQETNDVISGFVQRLVAGSAADFPSE